MTPDTARDEIRDRIADALWTELEHQAATGPFSLDVHRSDDLIWGRIDMDAAADAALKVIEQGECL